MENDQQGFLVPLEIIILGFAAHFTSGNDVNTVEDEALYDLQAALELEIERRGAIVH
jgi:hypothetical protein